MVSSTWPVDNAQPSTFFSKEVAGEDNVLDGDWESESFSSVRSSTRSSEALIITGDEVGCYDGGY